MTHDETIFDKVLNVAKDALGIRRDPLPTVQDERSARGSELEEAAEDAMKLDPNPNISGSAGQLTRGTYPKPALERDEDGVRREIDEHPREKRPQEYSDDLVKRENGF